ncbi:hypothetical protein RFI_29841 [Reticulomyxa filosa]|uniref:F-box domain-containing protein n=1 Tax=Reticulomyxa filosa TaxID=46433 RepID=X6M051_RETFI|nr:hypothetical protein RFI_29841 [Reticulomyxa filosa]|eukprot:ETO07553.1 hypothetical protein RFI_29841 [Reticulomyxa filosa]
MGVNGSKSEANENAANGTEAKRSRRFRNKQKHPRSGTVSSYTFKEKKKAIDKTERNDVICIATDDLETREATTPVTAVVLQSPSDMTKSSSIASSSTSLAGGWIGMSRAVSDGAVRDDMALRGNMSEDEKVITTTTVMDSISHHHSHYHHHNHHHHHHHHYRGMTEEAHSYYYPPFHEFTEQLKMPDNVLLHMLSFTRPLDQLYLCQVCKQLRHVIYHKKLIPGLKTLKSVEYYYDKYSCFYDKRMKTFKFSLCDSLDIDAKKRLKRMLDKKRLVLFLIFQTQMRKCHFS